MHDHTIVSHPPADDLGRLRENLIDLDLAIADVYRRPQVDPDAADAREAAILDELLRQHAETRAALARRELREVRP